MNRSDENSVRRGRSNSLPASFQNKKPINALGPDTHVHSIVAFTHEFRNPLTNINLAVGMLNEFTNDDKHQFCIDVIMRASDRINGLINELARQQQGESIPAAEHSMHELLDEVIALEQDRITLNNISIKKNYNIDDYRTVVDRDKMKIALTNIIINALDSMNTEGELKIATAYVKGQFNITIIDNGCGISKMDLKHIFKPFFSRKTGGLGIGLAATADILASNKIAIHVNSKEGKGTKFILSFVKSDTLL